MEVAMKPLVLCLVLVVGGLAFVPSVRANTPDLLNQILTAVGAVQAKTDKLPADPAATSDVTAARTALSAQIAALPVSGALRRSIVDTSQCLVVSGPIASGRERELTITAEATAIDANLFVVIDNALSSLTGYVIQLKSGTPDTFVESQTGGEIVRLCNQTPFSTVIASAIWTEGPAS
jgi:hypothetical protein